MRPGSYHRGMGSSFVRNRFYPRELYLRKWNKILLLLNVVAVSLDPLFFYIPVIREDKKCHGLDKNLMFTAIFLRTFTDIADIINIIFQFSNGFMTARKYLYPSFIVDILAVLPVPQVVILIVIPNMRGSRVLKSRNLLIFFVLFQYVPRLLRIYPLYRKVKMTSGTLTETAWAKAAFNLFLFMLASHVLGASWYFFSIERETACWQKACRSQPGCIPGSFSCHNSLENNNFLNELCPIKTPNASVFDFGIFLDALQSGIVESTDFPEKFFCCFWWGLRNLRLCTSLEAISAWSNIVSLNVLRKPGITLSHGDRRNWLTTLKPNEMSSQEIVSSFGQNLDTSRYMWENCFAVFITISGLVLFISLIGNMQIYLQSSTMRLEEMRLKGQDIEQWTSFHLLSANLQKHVKSYQQYKWRKTKGVDIENLLLDLPRDLRLNIKRELCLKLLSRVPLVEIMDERMIDAMCDSLKLVLYTEKCYIVRERDPVDHMLFVMQGELLASSTDGGEGLNSFSLKAGDFCGEELLAWAMDPRSSDLPSSTVTVQARVAVEAFALAADDLKVVLSQLRRHNRKQLVHYFRFYSQQWRTWAACYIQAAWRLYARRKLKESLRVQEAVSSTSLGATIYASRFAANALRGLRRSGVRKVRLGDDTNCTASKPLEPDFTDELVFLS